MLTPLLRASPEFGGASSNDFWAVNWSAKIWGPSGTPGTPGSDISELKLYLLKLKFVDFNLGTWKTLKLV